MMTKYEFLKNKFPENSVFVQIGTNNGDDEFKKTVETVKPLKTILIEPNSKLIDEIYKNYKNIENVFIENVAITDENLYNVGLYIPSNHPSYGDAHYTILPMEDFGENLDKIEAKGVTFNKLCKKYNINHVNFLQIDTEGYDSEIIKSINFNEIEIDVIKYEFWNFDPDCYKNYGEKGKNYGSGSKVWEFLESLNYKLCRLNADVIAFKNK